MHAWPASEVPALPGRGRDLRIHDTATGGLGHPRPRSRRPDLRLRHHPVRRDPHRVTRRPTTRSTSFSRAGSTPSAQVHYVQNVTDVDDPLLERAVRDGEDWTELAERETALFREDMTALRMLPPRHYIGAVEAIPGIVPLVERLRDAGRGLRARRRHLLLGRRRPALRRGRRAWTPRPMRLLSAERGGDPDRPGKKNPLDPMLWMAAREGEPSWDGAARAAAGPAGTSSASAIALDHLGMGFDVQGGGSDLAFPHHEMGASARPGARPASTRSRRRTCTRAWSAWTARRCPSPRATWSSSPRLRRDGVDPAAIRLALLAHHYRADWEWTDAVLQDGRGPAGALAGSGLPAGRAVRRRARWRRCARHSPTTWTRRRRWPPSTAGRAPAGPSGGDGRGRPRPGLPCGRRPARHRPVGARTPSPGFRHGPPHRHLDSLGESRGGTVVSLAERSMPR